MHPCPYEGSFQGFDVVKLNGIQGLVTGMIGKAFKSPVGGIKGLCCRFPSILLRSGHLGG